jgi:mono/diheme cytochrome c family protein
MTLISRYLLLFLVAAGGALACQKSPPPTPAATTEVVAPPAPIVVTPAAEARHIFDTRCAVCHGTVGKGDGPGSAALNPKPRAFGDATWQKSVDDAHIAKTIVEGGLAVKLSAGMAPNPDLADKPEVVAELVKIVRKFGQ